MKLVFSISTLLAALPVGASFVQTSYRPSFASRLSVGNVVTGPDGQAASSAEEDLQLTLKLIMDHIARSATATEEQFISQMSDAQNTDTTVTDISIPYDAAARLAYDASDKSVEYADFKTKYEANAVAEVIAKQPVDISIPYDAAAKLAWDASDKSMKYADFKTKYEANAVAEVIAKQPVDISIPYDAAAKLAYDAGDKSMKYADFKTKYEANAVAEVIAKQPVDISIPYDAAAKLAWDASDKSMVYAKFKVKFEADAVAEVIAKQNKD